MMPMPTKIPFLLTLFLLCIPDGFVLAQEKRPPDMRRPSHKYQMSWIGNSGSGQWDERRQMRLYTQMDVKEMTVLADGTVVAITWFDEGHQNIGVYKDGEFITRMGHAYGFAALAVAADEQFIYAGGTRRDSGTRVNVIRRYDIKEPQRHMNVDVNRPPNNAYQPFLGMALRNDTLYVSERVTKSIRKFSTPRLDEIGSFPVEGGTPRKLAVDAQDRVWVIVGGNANLDPGDNATIRGYQSDGTPLPDAVISDIGLPTAIAIDPQGRLLIADSTPGVNHIAIYDITAPPRRVGTFGRCITADVPGQVLPDKFDHITGLGTDAQGNFYVAWNGGPPSGNGRVVSNAQGQVIRSLKPDGSLRWELLGRHFIDNADADPADEHQVYARNERYEMDYSKPAGKQWTWKAYTLDRKRYPHDPRLWHSHLYTSQMLRLEDKLFMILQDQYRDTNTMYRFDGEIAVPTVMFNAKFPWDHPPNRPEGLRKFVWRDGSGAQPPDGHFDADEYHEIEKFGWGYASWSNNGDVWCVPSAGNRIVHYPFLGLDENGVPKYSEETATNIPKPEEFVKISHIEYDSDKDVMFLAGFFKKEEEIDYGGGKGKTTFRWIVRYDNWSRNSTKPVARSKMELTEAVQSSFTFSGDWIFAGEREGQPIRVFDSRNGRMVQHWKPGPEVGGPDWYGGGLDVARAIRAFRRANGEILVFSEEVSYSKILMHRWMPPQ